MQSHSKSLNANISIFSAIVLFVTAATVILANPSTAAKGAADGLKLSIAVVIPALFPFTVVALFFEKSGALCWLGNKLHNLFFTLFGISGNGGTVLLLSLLGGYPIGAKLLGNMHDKNLIYTEETKLLLRFCINPSPAFCLAYIGEALLKSRTAGLYFLIANTLSCLMLTALFGNLRLKNKDYKVVQTTQKTAKIPLTTAFIESVADSANIVLSITAWVTLFSCISSLLEPLLPQTAHATLSPLLEITFGATEVCKIGIPLYMFSILLAFGGFSTLCQVWQAAGNLHPEFSFLFFNRILHGSVAALISAVLFYFFPTTMPVWSNGTEVHFKIPQILPASVAFLLMSIIFLCTLKPQDKTYCK